MVKKLLISVVALFLSQTTFSQTDGWYQIDKPQTINAILPDDVDPDIIHLATNIGYIKYNISTNQVVDFLNATSQTPAIGNVTGLALNPTNNNIALALSDGIVIYDGTSTLTKYTYTNSSLTVGSASSLELRLSFGLGGELYLFKTDVFAYQVFSAGVFSAEVVTTFRPQDIEENHDGTKIFFAGFNDGLHEYTKATTSWANYTTSNSDLIYDPLEALYRDSSGKVYVGGFQGFNTIDSSGTWSTFQKMIPSSVFFYPAYDFSKNSLGELMVVTSKPNVSYNGLCLVDEGSNTWTRYYQDGTNCLNSNTFTGIAFGGNNKIFAAPQVLFGYGNLVEFTPSTDTCVEKDINYLNAPEIGTFAGSFAVREKTGGGSRGGTTLEIAFPGDGSDFSSIEVNPIGFNGVIENNNTFSPPGGNSLWDVTEKDNVFIFETNTGILVSHPDGSETHIEHGVPNYQSLKIKTPSGPSEPGIIEIVQRGTQNGDHKLFTNQIDITKNTSTPLQEVTFPGVSNIDAAQGFRYGFIKREDGGTNTSSTCSLIPIQGASNPRIFCSESSSPFTPPGTILIDEALPFNPLSDPIPCQGGPDDAFFIARDNTTLTCGIVDPDTKSLTFIDRQEDFDSDGNPDILFTPSKPIDWNKVDQGDVIARALCAFIGKGHTPVIASTSSPDPGSRQMGGFSVKTTPIVDASIAEVPEDFVVLDLYLYQNNATNSTMVLLTNYGLLIKSGIDLSALLLNTNNDNEISNSVNLMPNPANNHVSFNSDKITALTVYDINGRMVLEQTGNGFTVTSLAKGVYIVKGKTNEKLTVTKKLIVE